MTEGVSFVVPVHNGAGCIRATIEAIIAQADGRPMEIIVVDDQSGDASVEPIRPLGKHGPLRIIQGEGRLPRSTPVCARPGFR